MAASFKALPGAPHVICEDKAVLLGNGALWMYDHPTQQKRLSCGIYRLVNGRLALRIWLKHKVYFEAIDDEAALRALGESHRQLLEAEGWDAQ